MMRARAEGRPADSIGSFRHQLHVLKRTAPTAVAPANSLSARIADRRPAPAGVATVANPRPARTYTPDSVRRARTLRRRRDVLLALMAAMGVTFLLAIMGLSALWTLHVLFDAAFGAYVVMLVRIRNAAAERDMKLRFLPGAVHAEPALLLRRSAN
jgi:hypothetical protein